MITEAIRSIRQRSDQSSGEFRIAQSAREFPLAWGIGGFVALALVVYLGYWGYPELSRTVKMHRM